MQVVGRYQESVLNAATGLGIGKKTALSGAYMARKREFPKLVYEGSKSVKSLAHRMATARPLDEKRPAPDTRIVQQVHKDCDGELVACAQHCPDRFLIVCRTCQARWEIEMPFFNVPTRTQIPDDWKDGV